MTDTPVVEGQLMLGKSLARWQVLNILLYAHDFLKPQDRSECSLKHGHLANASVP